MPIANCLVGQPVDDPDAIVAAWSAHSGIDPREMTVNVIEARQGGKRYAAMAWLHVPSLWSETDVASLAEGLAAGLADVLGVRASLVQVVTSVVESGLVVDDGQILRW